MNTGLLGWPETRHQRDVGRMRGWPALRTHIKVYPTLMSEETVGTFMQTATVGTTYAMIVPPGTKPGDILVANFHSTTVGNPGVPTGWTSLGTISANGYAAAWKIADGSEVATSQLWTHAAADVITHCIRVVGGSTVFNGAVQSASGATPSTNAVTGMGTATPWRALVGVIGGTTASLALGNMPSWSSNDPRIPATSGFTFFQTQIGTGKWVWSAWGMSDYAFLPASNGVGTWTNASWNTVVIPVGRIGLITR